MDTRPPRLSLRQQFHRRVRLARIDWRECLLALLAFALLTGAIIAFAQYDHAHGCLSAPTRYVPATECLDVGQCISIQVEDQSCER